MLLDIRDDLEAAANPLTALAGGRRVVTTPLADLADGLVPALPDGVPVVVVCGNGSQSDLAAAYLEAAGLSGVLALDGGVRAWKRRSDSAR